MFVETTVFECDFTGRKYPQGVKGAGPIARGATGRWCIVMWAGPEYIAEHTIQVGSAADADRWIAKNGYPGDWLDL